MRKVFYAVVDPGYASGGAPPLYASRSWAERAAAKARASMGNYAPDRLPVEVVEVVVEIPEVGRTAAMDKAKVAAELVGMAEELVAMERGAAIGRKDFESLAAAMKSSGVAKNKKFVDFMVGWMKGQNPRFDEDKFMEALK